MTTLPAQLADISAECFVLSAAVYREDWLLDVLQSVTVDDFTRNETRAIFSVIGKMHQNSEKITVETLYMHGKELNDAGYIQGRDMTFSDIVGKPPMLHDFQGYIATLKEMTMRRHVLKASQTATSMILKGEMSEPALAEMEKVVMEKTATGMEREMLSPSAMGDAIEEAVSEREDKDALKKAVIYTSLGSLNMCCGGLEKGDLVILSAESGAGKSAFSMNLANGIACSMKRHCLYLNSEMQTKQIALRWASHLTGVSHRALRNGSASKEDFKKAKEAGGIMRRSALWTLNMPDMQIASVIAEVRRAKAKYDIEIAFVDYIGRMDTMNLKDAKDWQVMKSAAQRLKTLAVELQITVVMVAQLTSDGGRLAQSSYMSHEADLWLNIGKIAEDRLQECWPWNYVLTFRKARNVENGQKVMLRFDGDTLTFTDKESDAKEMAGNKPTVKTGNAREGDIPA